MRNPLFRRRAAPSPDGDGLGALCKHLQEILTVHGGDHKSAYESAHGGLKRLVEGLAASLPQNGQALRRTMESAKEDMRSADDSAAVQDHWLATAFQLYALQRLRRILGPSGESKLAYGYDISGELGEIFHGSEDIANRENQKNIDDTAQPFEQHETPKNPANLTRDYAAERDFQSLRDFKNKRINWPPRTR